MWRNKTAPHHYGTFTDIQRLNQCLSCTATQRQSAISEAKVQALSSELTHRKNIATQLQGAKLKIVNFEVQHKAMKSTIL